jgi:hypothetical protein
MRKLLNIDADGREKRPSDRPTDTIVVTLSSAKVPLRFQLRQTRRRRRKLEEDEREKEKEKKLGTKGGVEPVIKRRTPETKRQKQVRQGKVPGNRKKKKKKNAKSEDSGDIGSRRRNHAPYKTNKP